MLLDEILHVADIDINSDFFFTLANSGKSGLQALTAISNNTRCLDVGRLLMYTVWYRIVGIIPIKYLAVLV